MSVQKNKNNKTKKKRTKQKNKNKSSVHYGNTMDVWPSQGISYRLYKTLSTYFSIQKRAYSNKLNSLYTFCLIQIFFLFSIVVKISSTSHLCSTSLATIVKHNLQHVHFTYSDIETALKIWPLDKTSENAFFHLLCATSVIYGQKEYIGCGGGGGTLLLIKRVFS